MGISVNGNDIEFDGHVKVVNGFNPDTGVAYLILTPNGGTGQIPFMAQGLPGLSPIFDSITVEYIDPDVALPSPNPVQTLVNPGSNGIASHYNLKFYMHQGEQGPPGENTISTSTDLDPSVTLGSGTNGFTLLYNSTTGLWVPSSQKVGNQYVPGAIDATAYTNTSTRTLASVNVTAQPFPWRPRVFATTTVTGSADTRVNLYARLNNSASGDQIGFAKGVAGAAPPPMVLIPSAPAGSNMPGAHGRVAASTAATIYLVAEQKAASSNSWSTVASPDTTFWVEVEPLL